MFTALGCLLHYGAYCIRVPLGDVTLCLECALIPTWVVNSCYFCASPVRGLMLGLCGCLSVLQALGVAPDMAEDRRGPADLRLRGERDTDNGGFVEEDVADDHD